MDSLIKRIKEALTGNIDERTKENSKRFFKEEIKCYGVKVPKCKKIANRFWPEVSILKKDKIFELCERLFTSDYCEESYIVSAWLPKLSSQFEKGDWVIFKKWIELYINNWAKCDSFCNHTMGDFLLKFPEFVTDLKEWTSSANRWEKRAASVSLIIPARKGYFLPDIFEICDRLLSDPDDIVQKGYGWLLKAAGEVHQKEVFDYVLEHKDRMPRIALRYAIEKMPEQMRKEAMEK